MVVKKLPIQMFSVNRVFPFTTGSLYFSVIFSITLEMNKESSNL